MENKYIIDKLYNFLKNVKEKVIDVVIDFDDRNLPQEIKDLNKLKSNEYKNSFINNFDNILMFLKLNESKIENKENIANSLFLKAIDKKIKVDDIYNYFPLYLKEFILQSKSKNKYNNKEYSEHISKKDIEILETFKNNILNVKLELFKNIENNLIEFKAFEVKIINSLSKDKDNDVLLNDKESIAKFLSLSFYFYKLKQKKDKNNLNYLNDLDYNRKSLNDENIEENITSLIQKTKNILYNDKNIFFNNILPTNTELEILKTNDVNFNTGLEYEFWLNSNLFNITNSFKLRGSIVFEKINEFLKFINLNDNENIKDKDIKTDFSKIIEENAAIDKYGSNKQYFEIISKKFNSISEMLVFHDFILKIINQIKIEEAKEISFQLSRIKKDDIDKSMKINNITRKEAELKELNSLQEKAYKDFPGSIHFNVSIPNIENINRLKFYLFLKNKEIDKETNKNENINTKEIEQDKKDEIKYKNIMEEFVIRNDNVKDMNLLINIFGPHVIESSLMNKFWQINFSYLDKPDKTGKINQRLEIRYMGGENYPEKDELINSNLLHIMNCVKIAMNNDIKDNELYFKFIDDFYIDFKKKNNNIDILDIPFEKLDEENKFFLFKFLNKNDSKTIIKEYNDIIKELKEQRIKYEKEKDNYYNLRNTSN